MHLLDWIVVGVYLVWMVWDGIRRTEGSDKVEGLSAREPQPAVVGRRPVGDGDAAERDHAGRDDRPGLRRRHAVRAVLLRAADRDDHPVSVTLVPFFYRARVYTAYEYLERRFDLKTRTLASVLFLCSRGLSCGVIIAAPAVILSIVLGWNLTLTILAIGLPTAIYTMVGGVQAVTWTDVKQMAVIVVGLLAVVVALVLGLPADVSVGEALHVAGAAGRLNCRRLPLRLVADLHVLVRAARRAVPDAVVFRLRPEPGAALPDREVGGRRARLADDERVRQDPAAGAGPADRRARVRLLPVSAAADAVQQGARGTGREERASGGVPPAGRRVHGGLRGTPRGGRDARRGG